MTSNEIRCTLTAPRHTDVDGWWSVEELPFRIDVTLSINGRHLKQLRDYLMAPPPVRPKPKKRKKARRRR